MSVIEPYAKVLLAGDNESSVEQYDAIGPALAHPLEVDPGLTSSDTYEMVLSVMDRQFSTAPRVRQNQLDLENQVKNIDQNIIEPAFMSPTAEPAPAPTTRVALRRTLRSASKAAEKLRKGKGPKNFSMNETLRRSFGR